MPIFWFLIFIFATADLWAFNGGNPNSVPLGHRESLLANAGVAMDKSPASPYYNPAGIFKSKKLRISASAQAYQVSETNLVSGTDAFDESAQATSLNTNSIVSSFGTGKTGFAFSIFSPLDGQISYDALVSDNTSQGRVALKSEYKRILLGGSISHKFSDRLSLGATVFFERLTSSNISVIQGSLEGSDSTILTQFDVTGLSLYSVLGLRFQAANDFALGLRLQTTGFNFLFDTEFLAGAQIESDINTTELTAEGNFPVPWDITGGLEWKLGAHTLYLDLGVQFAITIDTGITTNSNVSSAQNYETAFRWHFGHRWDFSKTFSWLTGFQYNQSIYEVKDPSSTSSTDTDVREDVWVLTSGFSYRKGIMETVLGAYFSRGIGSDDNLITNVFSQSYSSQTYGVLLSTNFYY